MSSNQRAEASRLRSPPLRRAAAALRSSGSVASMATIDACACGHIQCRHFLAIGDGRGSTGAEQAWTGALPL